MTRSRMTRRFMHVGRAGVFLVCALTLGGWSASVGAQAPSPDELRRQVERSFDVMPVRDGLALRPKTPTTYRWVEISNGAITIDGSAVTGAELRQRLGDAAELVIRLSYLTASERRAAFGEPGADRLPPVEVERDTAQVAGEDAGRRTRRSRSRVRVGGSVTVGPDEFVSDDVVAIGGSVRVDGEVGGDVVAVGGSVDLGPGARVRRDVTVVGGQLRRDPTAQIGGEVNEVFVLEFGDFSWPRWSMAWPWWNWPVGRVFRLGSTLLHAAILSLFAALAVVLARDRVERVSQRAVAEPIKAGFVGFLAQLLFLPMLLITIIALIVTIIGIPLLLLIPFVIVFLCMLALVGFTGVAHQVGRWLVTRLGAPDAGPYVTTIAGVLLILSPLLVARLAALVGGAFFPMMFGLGFLGFVVEYVAWTIGIGAVTIERFGRKPSPMA